MLVDKGKSAGQGGVRLAVVMTVLEPVPVALWGAVASSPGIVLKAFVLARRIAERPPWPEGRPVPFAYEHLDAWAMPTRVAAQGGEVMHGSRHIPWNVALRLAPWRPDVIICSNITQLLLLLPWRKPLGWRIGVISPETAVTAAAFPRWHQRLRSTVYRQADFVVAYGRATAEYFRSIGMSDARIFQGAWGVEARSFEEAGAKRIARHAGAARWITSGQLVARKGFRQLVTAWAAQSPTFWSANHLTIVGDGPERGALQALIAEKGLAERITLTGHLSREDSAQHFAQADAFVFPTLMDHWGWVLNEAMAAGLPVLCSQYAGAAADLVREVNGRMFNPTNADDFARALDDFWLQRGRWPEMGLASKAIIAAYTVRGMGETVAKACGMPTLAVWPSMQKPDCPVL